jgi:perosamine synthetase
VGVHLFGQPFDVPKVKELCERHNLNLIEDAAQAHGATCNGEKAGSIGLLGCFSFYATKNMTTGEGGMITTSDKAVADRLRLIISHGQSEKYHHTRLGYNYRMTDMAAALGTVQLRKLEKFNLRRRKNAELYRTGLSAKGISVPVTAPGMQHVWHQYVIRVTDEFPLPRLGLVKLLASKGIGTAVHYPTPLHRQPLYFQDTETDPCPVSTRLAATVLSLPVHPMLDAKEIALVCDTINRVS